LRHIVSVYAAGYDDKRPVSVLLDLVEGMDEPTGSCWIWSFAAAPLTMG
jgi:hypothetical protein